jgi:ABC-type lipoprotein release transport system permease subunit
MWVRADLRRRWLSWVVLGVLAGVSAGIAAAGIAGARRTEHTIPNYSRAANVADAAILANDPRFDAAVRAKVAQLPEVKASLPFMVGFGLETEGHPDIRPPLLPVEPQSSAVMHEPIVSGRLPSEQRADEIVVNEYSARKFELHIGSTLTFAQNDPSDASHNFKQTVRVVGIEKAPSDDQDSMVSSAFYRQHQQQLDAPGAGVINEFVNLRNSQADFAQFQLDVQRVAGRPINVESSDELFGLRQLRHVASVERDGLLLFALAVIVGAGVLVGQALVRAVTAGASDLPTWRAMGADRPVIVRALVGPALVPALVGAVTSIAFAIALSPRFPIAVIRRYELDIGIHTDWAVIALAAIGVAVAIVAASWITAVVRIRRGERIETRPSALSFPRNLDLPPALAIGSRLATDPGRGRRAVPVRSALVGAIVGVIGVVACLTFRQGLADTVRDPARSGVVWNYEVAGAGGVAPADQSTIANDPAVQDATYAAWARAITINGRPAPTFFVSALKGSIPFVIVHGRAPVGPDELALAPTTARELGLHLGDRTRAGPGAGREMRVVGIALLPATSHTDYDQSAWTVGAAMPALMPREHTISQDFVEAGVLIRWKPGATTAAAEEKFGALNDHQYFLQKAALSPAVTSLGQLRSLPFSLAVFFALLACATVAHALVTTVRRRGRDLAILRSFGFTRRDTRIAIAWQATLLAIVGVLVGVPLGILLGRVVWKQIAVDFPVLYVPPFALLGVLLVIPVALLITNLIAAGPAHAATRVHPASELRTE